MAFLQEVNGPTIGKIHELNSSVTVLGRHPNCEIVVHDSAVSRKHAKIEFSDGECFVTDLKSRNGTQVNGYEVQAAQKLKHGDQLQICDAVFTFQAYQDEENKTKKAGKTVKPAQTRIVTEFVDDEDSSSPSAIRRRVDFESSYVKSDQSFSRSKLQTLIEITRALSQTLALDEVIPKVLDSLFTIFPQADRTFIVLCEPNGDLGRHWVQDRQNRETTLRVSRTIIKEAIRTKEAFLSEDAFSDQRFDMSKSIQGYSIRSFMCAPMLDNDENAIGCLQIDTLDPSGRFKSDELDLLATVALQAGISIENARMHEAAMAQHAIDRDLELAREVQLGLLPKAPPEIPGFDFYDFYEAANKVGGDFFDYIQLPDGRFCTIIADVAGHGIASALLMAKFSAEVRFALAGEDSASKAVSRINNAIIQLNIQRFITMVLAIFNPKDNKVTMVNAGHLDPLIRDESGVHQVGREVAGLPIGIRSGFEYGETEFELRPHATFLLYTDGVSEAMDKDGNQFGNDRVVETIGKPANSPKEIGDTLIKEVKSHEFAAADQDDTCLVCIGRGD